jgi:hypothetical protein
MAQNQQPQNFVLNASAIPADGIFAPQDNYNDTSFDPTQDSTYLSELVMSPADIPGTELRPYQPVQLGAYVPVLYRNAYIVNQNLVNDLSSAFIDNRKYPTCFAVQKYVADQISGSQVIGTAHESTVIVSNSLVNTAILDMPTNSQWGAYETDVPGVIGKIYIFTMDTTANGPKNGANKLVLLINLPPGGVVYLYSGKDSAFVNQGQPFQYYFFTSVGGLVEMIQIYQDEVETGGVVTTPAGWRWVVKNYTGIFSKPGLGSSQIPPPPFEGAELSD